MTEGKPGAPSPVSMAELDRIAGLVVRAANKAGHAALAADADANIAQQLAEQSRDLGRTAFAALLNMGATPPPMRPAAGGKAPDALDLSGLGRLDTPAARRLVEALEAAAEAGAALDRERGHVLQDGTPAGWGEFVGEVAATARREVFGAPGGGRE